MRQRLWVAGGVAVRGILVFLAAFTLLGVIAEVRGRTSDLALWFVDVRDLPPVVRVVGLAGFAVSLLAWAVSRRPGRGRRAFAVGFAAVGAIAAVRDVIRYLDATGQGQVRPASPVPLSLVFAVGLGVMAVWLRQDRGFAEDRPWRTRIGVAAVALAVAIAFPVAQIAFFGTTDYRRPADAAVILGARVYASGAPSPLLADRLATGIDLYRSGQVPMLVMSGGDGADGFNEALVMRDRAIAAGVAPDAILVDRFGINTDATVGHTLALLAGRAHGPALRLIAVSQAYHLPRIQLAFSQAGIDVLTVPAVDPIPISEMPLLIAREIPAFWVYYLRACLG